MKRTVLALGLIAGLSILPFAATMRAQGNQTVTQAAIDFAIETSDLMLNTLFAALLQEFAETTPANVEQGKHSISLIFDDSNPNMRLVGGNEPISPNDLPQDGFELTALAAAMNGLATTNVERVSGKWYYRRSVPLSNFHPACQMCHANFGPVNPSQWVGALMLRVPIPR